MFTDGTGATFFAGHGITTVSAGSIPPAVQRDISRPGVVGLQDLLDQEEEISQTAISESLVNRDFSFPLAERVSLDVWMMHVIRAGLRQGNNSIGLGITEFTPAEANFELTQIDFF